ncbi:hypothetical protein DFA_03033 [Cavenderia fasciculata]|uniref:EGF-like domain-containing protein n=1 Tax=Cavenderia fasciculata TaxID=261658 RepID=F4PGF5_CACFS|nr:uncharacterized protein DFA_03033 [Cavenderia fasciculata]EGG24789.1 hypothetical protein DFA_03033 [Cavenderia fasciculata]|eukprot:XP_004362640.1 hypothetical protein DFA_03033 [Cavenderia fasciculata]
MRILLSVLLLLGLVAALTNAALAPITSTTCKVTGNDYTTYGICFKNSQPDPPDPESKVAASVLAVAAEPPPDYNPWSCKGNPDDNSVAYGKIKVTVTGASTETQICNTHQCAQNSPIDTVKTWLNKYPLNKDGVTCYQSTTDASVVYLDASGFCSYNGVFNTENNTCTCQQTYSEADCSKFSAPDYTGSAIMQHPSIIMATIFVIIASLLFYISQQKIGNQNTKTQLLPDSNTIITT